ncbi:MAG: hypothetical protein [Satomivirus wayo]|uniref:Uncharacterized protein n=1 Tax=Bacteriophage sp. TaxID=38018 RepID=A0ABY5T6R1_9VIRU|nr:MAG: hypothetical protein [Bacteriophage sp.]UVY14739.1 MAG: hypothetical protein [Bacteriophage sp.]UWG23484.1 MAG: hypothetical protein [Bacteriophage sp.]
MLWGISWINIQIILADAPKIETSNNDDNTGGDGNDKNVHRVELKTKEDIKNYIKGLM